MPDSLSTVVSNRAHAHQAVIEVYKLAKRLTASGKLVVIECRVAEEPVKIKQRAFLHGAVLPQIAEQATLGGQRWTEKTWKEYFRRFLPNGGYTWRESLAPYYDEKRGRTVKPRKPRIIKERLSSESLGVKAYAEYTDKIIHFAATELAVAFHFDNEEPHA